MQFSTPACRPGSALTPVRESLRETPMWSSERDLPLFAPVKQLGLIFIDEEHDGAYKSDSTPKYHARETAIYRAGLAGASVCWICHSSVESFLPGGKGEYVLLTLKNRAGNAALPAVRTVDLRESSGKETVRCSARLKRENAQPSGPGRADDAVFERRGFAGFVSCRSCGTVIKCPHCDVSLTYHRNGRLRCHYCGYETAFSRQCPVCGQPHVAAFGLGTEKWRRPCIEEFPGIRVLRMDMDTTRRKNAHQEI